METDGDDREQGAAGPGESAPPPRNPFARGDAEPAGERPALIDSKRSAAFWGIVVALGLALLIGCICIMGSIAFAG